MRLRISNRKSAALTLVEVLIAVLIVAFLAALFHPVLTALRKKASKIGCVSELKQIGLCYRVWSGDHGDKYPTEVSVTNGGAMESAAAGDAVSVFQVMSNELSTPRLLCCPNDAEHSWATNFGPGLTAKNISYFAGLDAHPNSPQSFLSGDDNFQVDDVPVKSGLLKISSGTPIKWTSARHKSAGNICLGDGSIQSVSNSGLTTLIQQTGLVTNRLTIP